VIASSTPSRGHNSNAFSRADVSLNGFSWPERIAFAAVPLKKLLKKVAKKAAPKKSAPQKKANKPAAKKPVAKKNLAKKVPAKKAPAKKAPVKKAPAKIVPAKVAQAKKAPVRPIIKAPNKTALTSSTAKGGATTISVYKPEIEEQAAAVVEEKRLSLTPPPRPVKTGKKSAPLKPIKAAPAPLVVKDADESWSAAELKAIRSEIAKDLVRLKAELKEVESEMDDLIAASGVGAGDDQADAGTKTFEREHEMSLVYNARDMVLQTERALERIDTKTYGRCEDCGNAIGKARLQVFPRATLCMVCKQKEERR